MPFADRVSFKERYAQFVALYVLRSMSYPNYFRAGLRGRGFIKDGKRTEARKLWHRPTECNNAPKNVVHTHLHRPYWIVLAVGLPDNTILDQLMRHEMKFHSALWDAATDHFNEMPGKKEAGGYIGDPQKLLDAAATVMRPLGSLIVDPGRLKGSGLFTPPTPSATLPSCHAHPAPTSAASSTTC